MQSGEPGDSAQDNTPQHADPRARLPALLARHHTTLMGFVLSMVPSWPDAEDIVQETSAVLWSKFEEFEPGSNFVAWACQVARFQVMNHRRKRSRDKHVFSTEVVEHLAEEAMGDVERLEAERAALHACVEKLDPRGRDLLSRCYEPQAVIRDVAAVLGATPNSVYKALNRVRESLLQCIRRTLATQGAR